MTTFVLVHGAWHGAWCWEKLKAELEADGHRVVTPDLPGHGEDATPPSQVSLVAYGARITELLDAESEPVVLVGHSMGGMAISVAAERRPDKVARLVYLCAFLPRDGEALLAIEGRNPRPTVPPNLVVDESTGTGTIPREKLRELFYNDVDEAEVEAAAGKLTPQPLAPFEQPAQLGDAFAAVPKSYIVCTDDGAISEALQRDMIAASGVADVMELPRSHSPFLSAPKELAETLERLAA